MTYDMTYMWSLKTDANELMSKTEADSENTLMVTKGERQARGTD